LPEGATEVVVTISREGTSEVVQRIAGEDLRKPDGPDPVLERGQVVCVR
jgi:hypothetical protein